MTKYSVSVDVTVDVSLGVDATNEKEAEKEAIRIIEKDPYYYIKKGTWVGCVVTSIADSN